MRIILGASGLAAMSALVTAIAVPPQPQVLAVDPAVSDSTGPAPTALQVQRPVLYVQLSPGETAPPGAKVIDAEAPQPITIVTTIPAPAQKPRVIKTTQSGKVVK
jgi:hypothetical protein